MYYDEETAEKAKEEFDTIFVKKEIPDDIPELELNTKDKKLIDLMFENNLTDSKSNARRLIEQGGISINGKKLTDINFIFNNEGVYIIKVGKKKFLRVIIK